MGRRSGALPQHGAGISEGMTCLRFGIRQRHRMTKRGITNRWQLMSGPFFIRSGFLALLFALACEPVIAQDAPQLQTNQSYVEDVTHATALNVDDPMAVFGFVM